VADQWAGALYLVPVIVAAVLAFVVTRPSKKSAAAPEESSPEALAPVIPLPRPATYDGVERRMGSRRPSPASTHPTLFHAALSSHLAAVSRPPVTAATNASLAAFQSARLVSSRRPTRIPRRPTHKCPRKPQ
jgi:hypothetical protein